MASRKKKFPKMIFAKWRKFDSDNWLSTEESIRKLVEPAEVEERVAVYKLSHVMKVKTNVSTEPEK